MKVGSVSHFGWIGLTLTDLEEGTVAKLFSEDADGSFDDPASISDALGSIVLALVVALITRVSQDDKDEHKAEGKGGLPEFNDTWANDNKRHEEPNVGPGGENSGRDKHANHLDRLGLFNGNDGDGRDNKQVESGGTDDSLRAELARDVTQGAHRVSDRQDDLGCGTTECHKRQVGNRRIPEHLFDLDNVTVQIVHFYELALGGDLLNGFHEEISENSDAHKEPEEEEEVADTEGSIWK